MLGLNNYLGLLLTLLIVVSYIVLKKQNAVSLFPWERMIRIEQRHHTNYYKFVNMFTDVKHLKETAVRRRYLDPLLVTQKLHVSMLKICIYFYLHGVLLEEKMHLILFYD